LFSSGWLWGLIFGHTFHQTTWAFPSSSLLTGAAHGTQAWKFGNKNFYVIQTVLVALIMKQFCLQPDVLVNLIITGKNVFSYLYTTLFYDEITGWRVLMIRLCKSIISFAFIVSIIVLHIGLAGTVLWLDSIISIYSAKCLVFWLITNI
jgi:hypothetical protein